MTPGVSVTSFMPPASPPSPSTRDDGRHGQIISFLSAFRFLHFSSCHSVRLLPSQCFCRSAFFSPSTLIPRLAACRADQAACQSFHLMTCLFQLTGCPLSRLSVRVSLKPAGLWACQRRCLSDGHFFRRPYGCACALFMFRMFKAHSTYFMNWESYIPMFTWKYFVLKQLFSQTVSTEKWFLSSSSKFWQRNFSCRWRLRPKGLYRKPRDLKYCSTNRCFVVYPNSADRNEREELKIIAEQFQTHWITKKKVSGCLAVYTLSLWEI